MRTIIATVRVASDAEVKMPNESTKKCVEFRAASNEFYDGEGNTHWMRIRSHNERDIKLAPYLKKGKPILIEGQLKVSAFLNKEGKAVPSIDIEANRIEFNNTEPKPNAENGQAAPQQPQAAPEPKMTTGELPKPAPKKAAPAPKPVAEAPKADDGDDDLPF